MHADDLQFLKLQPFFFKIYLSLLLKRLHSLYVLLMQGTYTHLKEIFITSVLDYIRIIYLLFMPLTLKVFEKDAGFHRKTEDLKS